MVRFTVELAVMYTHFGWETVTFDVALTEDEFQNVVSLDNLLQERAEYLYWEAGPNTEVAFFALYNYREGEEA